MIEPPRLVKILNLQDNKVVDLGRVLWIDFTSSTVFMEGGTSFTISQPHETDELALGHIHSIEQFHLAWVKYSNAGRLL